MRHKLAQHQKQQQKMALTPQMRQSIELLAMPAQQLGEYIDTILEKNPFLKKVMDRKKQALNKHYLTSSSVFANQNTETQSESIRDPRARLLSQLTMSGLAQDELKIAEYLIYEMDENGYIPIDIDEAASDLSVNNDEVSRVLDAIHKMDPPGIGARDAQECLMLQLERAGKLKSLEYRIIKHFLNDLATSNTKKIARALDTSEDNILKAVKSIRKLNPKPASTILSKKAETVIPDLISHIKNKKISIGLNRDWFPRLKFYNPYENQHDIIKDAEVREFVKTNERAAKGLIDSLKRREDTMCRVADYILNIQAPGVINGMGHIKTLTMLEVARALKLHPSTISRAVSNKFVQLEDRVFPLKTLLDSGGKADNGKKISRQAIMNKLTSIIDLDDPARPLSDGKIKALLNKEGIQVERRTVAKYRTLLRILPRHLRKKNT